MPFTDKDGHHAVITAVQWRRAVSVSQHALMAELHIENIDFELN